MKKINMRTFVLTGMFVALVFLFGFIPAIGLIPLGFINLTLLHLPVIIGTLLLGFKPGLLLGACFGIVSSMSAFGIYGTPSALAAALVAAQPLLALIVCFVPRLLVPTVTHFVYKFFSKKDARSLKAIVPAAVLGSLTNTIFYLGLMLLFYITCDIDASKILEMLGSKGVLTATGAVAATGLVGGAGEAILAGILSKPVLSAVWKLEKHI